MSNLAFIEDSLGKLRSSEIKVAEYVLGHPEKVIYYSVHELADSGGVSEPTVIRFCRNLGFQGFQDFKIRLAQAIIPSVRTIHESVAGDEDAPDLVKKVFEANMAAVRDTLGTLDFLAAQRAIATLTQAEKIIFHGLGGSAVVAMDAYHKFFRTGIPCEWFNDTHLAAMAAALMSPKQVFVAISHSGASRDVVEATRVAKETGAATVAIVSHGKSPISKVAGITLRVASSELGFKLEPMSSRIAQLCVIDVLAVGVSLSRSDTVVANLVKSRKALVGKRY